MIIKLQNGDQIRKMQTAAGGPIHYSRTLTPENLSKAANYVGGYVLKGLGALGKFLNAGFTSPTYGTTGQVSYARNAEDAKRLRELSEASEQAMGKAMTWVSPLNYGTALVTGNGLNARKGEEEVASWSPAWQAIGRLGELYLGPKAVKGPRAVINAAAKAGVKPAKAAVIAREIKLATKNKPKHTEVPSKNLFRAKVYKGGYIKDPNSAFFTTDIKYARQYGPAQEYIIETKNPAFTKEPMMGYRDPVSLDMFVYEATKNNPEATMIIGHDANTGEFAYLSNGMEMLSLSPNNIIKTGQRRPMNKTYPVYLGPKHSIKEVVNADGTINPRAAMRIQHEIAGYFDGYKMEHRLEDPRWHRNDPTTYQHTKNVAKSAWGIDTPIGFTKLDQMVAAIGHDFGKMISGEGHAQIGADLARQVFPDLTDALYTAIAEHMGTPTTPLGLITKAADITNGRQFTYLQQYAPGLYNQYLGNTIYKVTQPNGKVRLLLPSHTEAKPREITLEPLGNNKFYTHMRIWDDVEKQVPGKINDVEKNNLFLAIYETLPDGAEILFPKSGPGFYGTRGTVAGLQKLSRDSRFKPGTPGTLLYLDKDGKTVRTYNGTSFIKNPQMEDVTTLNTGSLSRKPVYLDGHGLLEYQDYITALGDKFKNGGARVELPDLNAGLWKEFDKKQFVPVFLMWPGKSLRAHGLDIIRRMEQQGMDVDKIQGHLPLVGDGSIKYLITKNSELPSFIGYYKRPGSAGTYFSETGTTIIDPTRKNSTVYSMLHERNMHGTLRLLTPEMWKPYEDFLYKLFPNLGEEITPMGRHLVAYNSDNLAFPINPRSLSKKELRATLGEYRKYLYDNVAYPRAKADGLNVKPWDLDVLRPYFENAVDELTFPDAKIGLRDTNGYGLDYAGAAANHPNFLEELKWLLKYAPASLPLLIPRKEEKK